MEHEARSIAGVHKPNAQTHVWITPPEIVSALGGAQAFDLDPCQAAGQPWPCAKQGYTKEHGQDGLKLPWFGRVYCNPPYGRDTGRWLSRLAEHGNGCALVFARTETSMFFRHVWPKASGIMFLEGRLTFHRPDGTKAKANSGGPSCVIAYGDDELKRLASSSLRGQLITLRQ